MLIGYFDLISKIEIDRKNILNPKMCANPFILDIYSYFVERSFYLAPVLYACKYIPIQVLSIGLSICRCCCTISQCNFIYDADIRLNDSIKGVTNNIII